jgi:CRP/FNR family transcriptional regulator, cyclic AMP receptor protein
MRTLQPNRGQTKSGFQAQRCQADFTEAESQDAEKGTVREFAFPCASELKRQDVRWADGTEGFFKDLPTEARSDFELSATQFHCPGAKVLISEKQKPSSILFLLEGEVNISMNSSDGRRFLLEVAGAGDMLGLTSAMSGGPSEIRAEARYPCRIASLRRKDFLEFLVRYPIASQNMARELCLHYMRACERLRILGLSPSAMAKLAYLLLEWCKGGQQTGSGIQIRCLLSHQEIGEHIGISRETVSRTMTDFKYHDLVRRRGSTLVVTNRRALAIHAGINSVTVPNESRLLKPFAEVATEGFGCSWDGLHRSK